MLQLANKTPYAAERAVFWDLDGSEIWVVALKATFDIQNGKPVVAETQDPVRLVDEYYGEPGRSSIKFENEVVFRKPGTDVIVNGHAYAPSGKPATRLDVQVAVAGVRRTIRVYGDRFWQGPGLGLTMSSPRPFLSMPLVYERAFGGTDLSAVDPEDHGAEARNPIGAGFAMSRAALKGRQLPNLENPQDEISSWNDRPAPAGLGFIGKHWEPRRRFTGTCDDAYIRSRLPLYPLDFDTRFFLGASPGLAFVPHLRGGEPISLRGMSPEGVLEFALPRIALGFRTRLGNRWVDHQARLGTVVIEPEAPRIMMTWQTFLPCHRQTFELEHTLIFEKELL